MDSVTVSAPIHLLRLPQVCEVTGLCKSVVYQLEAEQRFPKRVRITQRSVGWIEDEVQRWLSDRVASSRNPTLPEDPACPLRTRKRGR
jgi:prophage regulatory protein